MFRHILLYIRLHQPFENIKHLQNKKRRSLVEEQFLRDI